MDREKGQTVASMTCPNCGSETPLDAQPDGSLAQSTCSSCYGTPEVASTETKAKREKATDVIDFGTVEVVGEA